MRTVSGTLRPTPLPWLPVLSHIAPSHLRRKEATAKLLAKICRIDSLPLHADIENHPPARLPSRHPIWLDVPQEELSALGEWCDEWPGPGADVINQSLVDDPTALPPGFNLPRHLWANLNRVRTGQGQCAANLARWRKIPDPSL